MKTLTNFIWSLPNRVLARLYRSNGDAFDTRLQAGDLVTIEYNHRTMTVLVYDPDPNAPDDRWAAFEAHHAKRGYFVQIIIGARSNPLPDGLGL